MHGGWINERERERERGRERREGSGGREHTSGEERRRKIEGMELFYMEPFTPDGTLYIHPRLPFIPVAYFRRRDPLASILAHRHVRVKFPALAKVSSNNRPMRNRPMRNFGGNSTKVRTGTRRSIR